MKRPVQQFNKYFSHRIGLAIDRLIRGGSRKEKELSAQCMAKRHILRVGLGPVLALMVAGCATHSEDKIGTVQAARLTAMTTRDASLNSIWKGQSYDALREALGEPELLMNIPGRSPLLAWIVVYGVLDEKSKCVDTFTLVNEAKRGELTVAAYSCR